MTSTGILGVDARVLVGRSVLVVIVCAGVLLRVLGLGWGIPRLVAGEAALYRTSFHPDERTYIAGILSMKPGAWDFDVHDYHWGTLQFYLVGAALTAARVAGYLPGSWKQSYLDGDPFCFRRVYVLGRAVSALAGILTLLIAFFIGRELKDTDTGITAAAFLSVLPLHVVNSHFLTSDVTMVFLLLVSFCLFLAWMRSGRAVPHLAGAVALGLAVSAKYNAAFFVPLWIAGEIAAGAGRRWKSGALACGAMLAGFAAGEPYALVHAGAFLQTIGRAFFSSSAAVREAMLPWPRLLLEQMEAMLRFGAQWTIGVPAVAGFLACVVRPSRQRLALAGSIVLLLASLVFARWPMLRYTLPLVCLGAVAAALSVAVLPLRAAGRLGVAALLCVLPLLVSLAQVRVLRAVHPANLASEWVYANVPEGSRIGRVWGGIPALDERRYGVVGLRGVFDADSAPNDSDRDVLILDNLPIVPPRADFLDRIRREYCVVAQFRVDPRIGPWKLDERDAPHDWKYTHPVITILHKNRDRLGCPDFSVSVRGRPLLRTDAASCELKTVTP